MESIVIDSMEDVRSCLLNMRSIIRNMVLSVPVHHCVSSIFCIDYSQSMTVDQLMSEREMRVNTSLKPGCHVQVGLFILKEESKTFA